MYAAFDTHAAHQRLTAAGVAEKEADALVTLLNDGLRSSEIVTHADLHLALSPIQYELKLHTWMVGASLAGIGLLLFKAFAGIG